MFGKFNLRSPVIIQAPMAGGITTPALVATVSNAGGLGSFATGYLKTEDVVSNIQAIKKLTSNFFAVNVSHSSSHDTSYSERSSFAEQA